MVLQSRFWLRMQLRCDGGDCGIIVDAAAADILVSGAC